MALVHKISPVNKCPCNVVPDSRYLRLKHWPKSLGASRKIIRAVDLYAGAGALSLGVWEACRRLGLQFMSVAAVDIDGTSVKVYEKNFGCLYPFTGDILSLIDGEIGSKPTAAEAPLIQLLGPIDIVLSGSPCQGFSPLNNHTRGTDQRNDLYLRATRLVELSLPEHALFENVPDVVNGSRDVVGVSEKRLKDLGYNVDTGIIDLSLIGVPQTRKRHVLVASRSKSQMLKDIVKGNRVRSERSVRWAIKDLEREPHVNAFTLPSRQTRVNARRIRYLRKNHKYDLPNWMRPECHRTEHSYKSMYGRLNYDKPAQTITSGYGSPGQGRYIHPTRLRTLTPHEAARLQLFPDFFDFSRASKKTSLARMIGNAAPMKLSLIVATRLFG